MSLYRGLGRTGVIECIPVEEDNIDIGQPLISIPPAFTMSDNELMITSNNVTTDERKENGCKLIDRRYIDIMIIILSCSVYFSTYKPQPSSISLIQCRSSCIRR